MEIGMIAAASAASSVAPAVALTPDYSLATQQFAALMSATAAPATAGQAGVAAEATNTFLNASLTAVQTPTTLGGKILGGLRGAAADFSDKWSGIASRLDAMAAQPSVADMLRLQTDLMKVSVQYELVGKVVSKSTQNLDSLVRLQ